MKMRFVPILCGIAASLVSACSDPEPTDEACGELVVTDRSCSFDGECSDYRVCRDGACATPEAMAGDEPAGQITVGETTFSYELAAGDFARARGLSGRPCMADGWGVLLTWPDADERQIDVSQMRFDLDLLFLDEADQPVSVVYGAAAGSKVLYGSDGAAMSVLEVPAGSLPDPVEVVSVR